MQCACAILSSGLPRSTIFFHIISQTARFSGEKKKLTDTKCVSWFRLQRLSETFLILRRNEQDMIKNVYRSSCKVPLCWSDFNENLIFSTGFRKTLKCQISWKSTQQKPSYATRTDGRTDMTKLIVTFRSFTNSPKITTAMLICNMASHNKHTTNVLVLTCNCMSLLLVLDKRPEED